MNHSKKKYHFYLTFAPVITTKPRWYKNHGVKAFLINTKVIMAIAIIQSVWLAFHQFCGTDLLKEKRIIISARSVIQFLWSSECPEKIHLHHPKKLKNIFKVRTSPIKHGKLFLNKFILLYFVNWRFTCCVSCWKKQKIYDTNTENYTQFEKHFSADLDWRKLLIFEWLFYVKAPSLFVP